jgi:ligand-binding sensor domain-containing protein
MKPALHACFRVFVVHVMAALGQEAWAESEQQTQNAARPSVDAVQSAASLAASSGEPANSVAYAHATELGPLPSAIYSNTTVVKAMASDGRTLWVATQGGLEEYDVRGRERIRVYTTNDGLPALAVDAVKWTPSDVLVVSASGHDCVMPKGTRRFTCSLRLGAKTVANAASPGLSRPPVPTEQIEGATVTARLSVNDGSEWIGTAGMGTWVHIGSKFIRVTPREQIASNHVVAVSEWGGSIWFATFDHGLSELRGGRFMDAALGPRMLNDVIGTDGGLFVATSEGLFVSEDGSTFRRESRVTERSVTDLAYDPRTRTLYATATNSLWEVSLSKRGKYVRASYQPGGTRSLQAVDVSPEGTVFLASEDRGVLRREEDTRFTVFDRLAGFPSSWVIDVVALGEHAALAGTLRHGVFDVFGDQRFDKGLDSWVLFLGRDPHRPGAVLVGTQGGGAIVAGSDVQTLRGLPNKCVHTMARAHDGVWVGTEGGLARYVYSDGGGELPQQ